ncbi:MAG TPA: amino acid permease [Streptosporangiaceae bacterium]|jgi:amino acid efflux transporter
MSAPARARTPSGYRISLPHGIALYVGAVLGTGVIALPALAARTAGPASLVAWAALILASIPLAGVFAALARRHPDAGGVATFAARAFGRTTADVTGWWFWIAVMIGVPALGLFGGAYVASLVGGSRTTTFAVAAALMAVGVTANAVGLRMSGRLQLGLAGVLTALLVTAVAVALPHARAANLHPFAPHGWTAVGLAATLLVWSFQGWEAVTHLSGEFADPARDLPRATAVALAVVGVLYLGVAYASVAVLGPRLGRTGAPLADLFATGVGGPARAAATAVAVVLTLGTMNAYIGASAKLAAALGRDGALPAGLARGGGAGQVPRRALATVASGAAVTLAVLWLTGADAQSSVQVTTACFAAVYVVGTAAGLRLLPRGGLAWWAALVALVAMAAVLALTGPHLLWPLAIGAAAIAYRRWTRRPRPSTPAP